jgi:hypothetical protein
MWERRCVEDLRRTLAALAAMDAEGLRALIRDLIPWLDETVHAQLVNALVDRAARNNASGWIPDGPTSDAVDEIVRFAEAAQSVCYAYPAAVDNYLGQGSNAFLAKDYRAAFRIFHALLIPMGSSDMSTKCLEPMGEFTQTFPA